MGRRALLLIAVVGLLLVSALAEGDYGLKPGYTEKVDAFEKWYKDRNPVVDKIKLGARVGGTNVHGNASVYLAIENINEGDQIFEAPEELVISQKTVDDSPIGHLIKANEKLSSALSAVEKLAVWFLYAKNCVPSGTPFFWSHYIDVLPEVEDLHHVLLMTDEEVAHLKGSFAYETALELKERSAIAYQLLSKELFSEDEVEALTECKSLSETSWNWAMATVLGRSDRFVDLAIKEEKDRVGFPVVVPYLDFIGYYPTAGALLGRTKDGVYHAELEYYENMEVFRGHSADCGAMLFVRFGLYLQDSPYACSSLPVSFMNYAPSANSEELNAQRERAFARLEEAGLNKQVFHVFESTITEELLLRSEMVNMNLDDYKAIDTATDEEREAYSVRTRIRAFRWLSASVRSYIQDAFPTTIEQDAKLLDAEPSTSSLTPHARLALQIVHDEKETLLAFVEEIDQYLLGSKAEAQDNTHDEL